MNLKGTTFAAVPIHARFIDRRWPEGWCIKTSDTTAIDSWCAKGFELGFAAQDPVLLEPKETHAE